MARSPLSAASLTNSESFWSAPRRMETSRSVATAQPVCPEAEDATSMRVLTAVWRTRPAVLERISMREVKSSARGRYFGCKKSGQQIS